MGIPTGGPFGIPGGLGAPVLPGVGLPGAGLPFDASTAGGDPNGALLESIVASMNLLQSLGNLNALNTIQALSSLTTNSLLHHLAYAALGGGFGPCPRPHWHGAGPLWGAPFGGPLGGGFGGPALGAAPGPLGSGPGVRTPDGSAAGAPSPAPASSAAFAVGAQPPAVGPMVPGTAAIPGPIPFPGAVPWPGLIPGGVQYGGPLPPPGPFGPIVSLPPTIVAWETPPRFKPKAPGEPSHRRIYQTGEVRYFYADR